MAALWNTRRGRLSWQVLREYYVTMTRKLDRPRDPTRVRDDVLALRSWNPGTTDFEAMELAWAVQDRYGLCWWDALIVAAGLRSGSRWLLTEDLQDGQDLMGITVMSPFARAPDPIPRHLRVLRGHQEEGHPGILHGLRESLDTGQLPDARAAPGGPHVDEENLTPEGIQGDGGAAQCPRRQKRLAPRNPEII